MAVNAAESYQDVLTTEQAPFDDGLGSFLSPAEFGQPSPDPLFLDGGVDLTALPNGLDFSTTSNNAPSRRGPPDAVLEGPSRRRERRMAAIGVLKRWFSQHRDNPYPSKGDKLSLADQTGMTVPQVSTWFSNTRRRRKDKPSSRPVDIMQPPLDSTFSPMERWRNSPPDDEAASLDAIMGAVINSDMVAQQDPSITTFSTPSDSRSIASSNASDSAASSASSAQSVGSHSSAGSFSRFYAAEPQRRRRRKRTTAFSKASKKPVQEPRPFQCTFCTDRFRTKYDWTRHEKTLHLSLESWTCCPSGPTYASADTQRCVFCDHPEPCNKHAESHMYSSCQEKPEVLRTFYRKDHLVQHLRLVHNVHHILPGMSSWKSQVDQIASRCGLCDETFTSWSARNEHLAHHFREGAQMKDWKGSRGLDPSVALAVENAMPSYLIGREALTLDPYSASRMADCHWSLADSLISTGQLPTSLPSPFDCFHLLLSDYVRKGQAASLVITDTMLQGAGRMILFGEDDQWDQTPADNSEWLNLFKKSMGLDFTSEHNPQENKDLFPLFDGQFWNSSDHQTNISGLAELSGQFPFHQVESTFPPGQYNTNSSFTPLPPEFSDVTFSSNVAKFNQYYNDTLPADVPLDLDSGGINTNSPIPIPIPFRQDAGDPLGWP